MIDAARRSITMIQIETQSQSIKRPAFGPRELKKKAHFAPDGAKRANGMRVGVSQSTERFICHCLQITEREIRGAISTGTIQSLRCVMEGTGAGTGCTACLRKIQAPLDEEESQSASPSPVCVLK